MALIQEAHEKFKGIYGYRRMTIYLNHFQQAAVNHKCVYRLMKWMGIQAVIRRKRYRYKAHTPSHVAENVLNRAFQEEYKPFEILLTDVTEFKYGTASKAYLSTIYDYGAKKVVAYHLSNRNNNTLVRDTVAQITDVIMPAVTLIHSDQGSQYTSHFFNHFIDEFDLIQSMSRAGKCIDNGPMESFWGTIKEEMYRLKTYDTFEALEADIHRYITFYNEERVTLSMGLSIPV